MSFLRMATGQNMTITVTMEELKELEMALTTHYHNLDLTLAKSVHLGGPNEAGIQKCIQRQKVGYLLERLRLSHFEQNAPDHRVVKSIVRSEVSTLRAGQSTWGAAA
jgi:hypothetical protein